MELPRPLVFGNWKMNGTRTDGTALCAAVTAGADASSGGLLGIFPPATLMRECAGWLEGSGIVLGGQDCHAEPKGAFTGDVSAPMLVDCGAVAVIVGHSERRHGLGETDTLVRAKAEAGLSAGLLPVICIGETEAEYLDGKTLAVLGEQLAGSVPDTATAGGVVVAYEPVWAIGTGRTPSLEEIAAVHLALRDKLTERFADGADFRLLYGGSVKPGNAGDILGLDAVDGALVGGASLNADDFLAIHRAGLG